VPALPGFSVEILSEVDSTNSELMRRARNGVCDPVLLVARRQTAGRGRMGRQWHSDTGHGGATLTFSLGLALQPADWSGLSLVAGVAVAQALHPDLQLKWPNDIWLHGRKLGGILIETATLGTVRYAVVGVGLNLAHTPDLELRTPAASLCEVVPDISAADAFLRVAPPLVHAVQEFATQGFAPFQGAFTARDALRGCEVSLSDGTLGVARGVNSSGALLVHTAAGLVVVNSAEVSVLGTSAGIPRS